MKKTFKIVTILLLIVAFAFCLFACNKDEQKPEESSDTTVVMTESYERGRAEFKAVTGIELPALADITVEEFPYEEGATSYELDITEGVTHDTFDVIVEFLNTALASWTKEGPTTDGEYTNIWWRSNNGSIGITWDEHNTAVYVHAMMNANGQNNSNSGNNNNNSNTGDNNSNPSGEVTMTDGYARARNDFQTATGLLLPELEKVNGVWFADEKSLDIGGSTEENGATQATLEAVNAALQKQINVQPTVSGGRTTWTYSREKEGVTYQCMLASFYQREGTGGLVVLLYSEIAPEVDPTDSDVNMTASYKEGRKSFYQISGLLLPALENVELSDESVFDAQKKEAQFIVANNNVFSSMVQAVKTALADEPLADNNKHWEQEGFMAFWEWDYEADGRMHKVTIQLENNTYTGKVTVGYWFRDYYTITLTATAGGSVELDIAGRAQGGNTAHVCYNTSSDLIATAIPGYRFLGFYEGETLLSAENPYEGYMIVKDVTIEARFEEIPSNMTEGYKTARNNLYAMSGIMLPALEDVTTDHETYDFDDENHVRDEFDCDFTFASAEAAAQAFTDFSAAIALVDGDAEESGESDAIWSKLYEDAVIPYRDDVMMFLHQTTVSLMWRKQPIAFYNVTVEGEGGTADIVYTGANYEDVRVQRHWEIVDAFGGRIVATPAQGYEFDGWYVNGQLVSEDADYRFRLSSEKTDPVDFTEITFVAKFVEAAVPTVQMTESYAEGREAFQTITGFLLPELSGCEVIGSSDLRTEQHTVACFDITGTADDMATIVAALTTQIEGEPYSSDASGTAWRYQYTDNGRTYSVGINTFLDTDVTPTCVYVNYYVQAYYEITVTAGSNGSVAMEHNEETVPGKQIATYADDLAVLTATPDNGYTFVGWFCNDEQISTDNPYYFTVEAEDAVIEARFAEEEPEAEMTESYAAARMSFQTASGLLLPEFSDVNGMCEDLGANMWMVDISGATEDTLASVIEAFDEQTGVASMIDKYGKNVWVYATSELSCFYNEGIVVIMYEEKQMSDSYAAAKGAFSDATGIILPVITDLDVNIAFGETYVMFDIVGGENLTYDTYEQFLSYFDGINGWTGQEDEHSSESYPTYAYNNTTSGVSFQVVWNGESESGGIYLNVFNTLSSFDQYAAAKAYLSQRFEIDLPDMEGLSINFSCAADATWMTFDMTGENNFTEEQYEAFVTALSAELGEGTDDSDEYQKRTTWTIGEILWDVVWDLTTGLAVNFG